MKNFLWKRLFAGVFLLLLATGTSFAAYGDLQQSGRTVTCVVSDNAGPVIGAYVVVRGTMNGGSTDADGRVVLNNVPDNTTLVVTYLGYVTQEIALMNNQTFVNRNKKCSDFGKKNYSGNGNSLCSNFGNNSAVTVVLN